MTVDKREKNETGAQSNTDGQKPKPRDHDGAVLRDMNDDRKADPDEERAAEKQDSARRPAAADDTSDEDGAVMRKMNDERESSPEKDADKVK